MMPNSSVAGTLIGDRILSFFKQQDRLNRILPIDQCNYWCTKTNHIVSHSCVLFYPPVSSKPSNRGCCFFTPCLSVALTLLSIVSSLLLQKINKWSNTLQNGCQHTINQVTIFPVNISLRRRGAAIRSTYQNVSKFKTGKIIWKENICSEDSFLPQSPPSCLRWD